VGGCVFVCLFVFYVWWRGKEVCLFFLWLVEGKREREKEMRSDIQVTEKNGHL
jgi:hypothetical protein